MDGTQPGEGYYRLGQLLKIPGLWEQMVPSATQIIGGRFNGEVNSTYLLGQQMDSLPRISQLQDIVSITCI